jgi:hypothetical protein
VLELQQTYINKFQFSGDRAEYHLKLIQLYENVESRPFACILLYNYFREQNDVDQMSKYFNELWAYKEVNDVSIFLFRELGLKLYDHNKRIEFFALNKDMFWYKDINPLRYNYFNFVAEIYNKNFKDAQHFINQIRSLYTTLNPEFKLKWMEDDGITEKIFDGHIVKVDGKYFHFRSTELQKNLRFSKENYSELVEGQNCKAKLNFYLNGVWAVLVK